MSTPPLVAEPVLQLGSFPVTNAVLNGWMALALFAVGAFFLRRPREIPGRFQNAFEMIVEGLLGFFDQVTNDRAKSKKFFPLVGGLFLFILVSNWLGLLPGTGSIGIWTHDGAEFVPLFRPATSDLNLTLGMAFISVLVSHALGIMTVGFLVHANKFIQLGTLWKAVKSLKPVNILVGVIEFVVGLIEMMSELAKVASLSLRLFGNVFAGEVLLTVMASLAAFFIPLPFVVMEIIVGIVQAAVFSMLTLVYLTIMTTAPHQEEALAH